MDSLPEEILALILEYADADRHFLRASTLISRAFVPIAQRLFYSSIALHSKQDNPGSTSERLSQLTSILNVSPHLLSYTTKLAYVVPTGTHDSDRVLEKEAECLERIVHKLSSLQNISLGFNLGPSRWKPVLAKWDALPDRLRRALRHLLALPELEEVHCQDIDGLPFDAIPWTSISTLCLNNASLSSSDPLSPTSSKTLGNSSPSRSSLPLEDLVVTVLPSPWLNLLFMQFRLSKLRRLVLSQADESKYDLHIKEGDGLRVDYEAERHAVVALLNECKENLQELSVYLPHYDPCSRPDQHPDNLHGQLLDLSEHRNLKRLVKRMIWPSPDVVSPDGTLLKEPTGVGLDPTYVSLADTVSTIKSEACAVVVEFNWRSEPIALFEDGQGIRGFQAIDHAFAENTSISPLIRNNILCADIFHLADARDDMNEWMTSAFPLLDKRERLYPGLGTYREIVPAFDDVLTCSSGNCRELLQEREWQEPERDDADDEGYGLFSCRITL